MVKLRLKRMGRKFEPHYRIVAADSRTPRDGKFIEELGWFNPRAKDILYKLNIEGIKKWLANGAQPSETVKGMLIKEGVLERDKGVPLDRKQHRPLKNADKRRKHRKPVAKPEQTATAAVEANA